MFLIDPPRRFALRQSAYILRKGVSQGILVIERCVQLRFMPVVPLRIPLSDLLANNEAPIGYHSSMEYRSLAR